MALTGNERVQITGVSPTGGLAATDESVTVDEIAALGGSPAVGPAGTVQMSDGSGGFVVSDFFDLLSTPGGVTARLVDTAGIVSQEPGFELSVPTSGDIVFAMTPVSVGACIVELASIGSGAAARFTLYSANGTIGALTETLTGDDSFQLESFCYTGTQFVLGFRLIATAASDFSGTPTTTIDMINASNKGLHVAANGGVTIDGDIASPGLTIGAADTATGAETATFTNAPVAGDPVAYMKFAANGTVYCIPLLALP